MKSKSNNALVTGGAGFVGSHLVDRLISEGYKIRIVDNLSSGRLENIAHNKHNPNFELIVGDLKKTRIQAENKEQRRDPKDSCYVKR